MILSLGFLLLVSLVVSSILSAVGDEIGTKIGMSQSIAALINFVVQALVVFVIFAAIFKFIPDAQVRWRDVSVGTAFTTFMFLPVPYGMQLYFSYSEPGAP